MKTVKIHTVLAWKIVNYLVDGTGLKMPNTRHDSLIETPDGTPNSDENHPLEIFNEMFPIVNYSFSSGHGVLYRLLRPEIIFQHPKILQYSTADDAYSELGEKLELSTELQYPHHKL